MNRSRSIISKLLLSGCGALASLLLFSFVLDSGALAAPASSFDFPLGPGYARTGYDFLSKIDFCDLGHEEFCKKYGTAWHNGEDWGKPGWEDFGDPVKVVANGKVVTSGNFGGCLGHTVMVEHVPPSGAKFKLPNGIRTDSIVWSNYIHMSARSVSGDQNISKGQKVGEIGTGGCWSPHLHWEIRYTYLSANANTLGFSPAKIRQYFVDPSDFIDANLRVSCFLIKGSGPAVYFVEKEVKRHIPDPPTFEGGLGFRWEDICVISDADLNSFPTGTSIESVYRSWVISHFPVSFRGASIDPHVTPPVIIENRTRRWLESNWGFDSPDPDIPPDIPADNFSSRYVTVFPFPTSGLYDFKFFTDDGLRFWIDNQLVVDAWVDQARTIEFTRFLTPGDHLLRIEHFEGFVVSRISTRWYYADGFAPIQLPEDGTLITIIPTPGGGLQVIVHGDGGPFRWLTDAYAAVRWIFRFASPAFVSWEQFDKDYALILGFLIEGQDGVDRLLLYAPNAPDRWGEVGYVDMSPYQPTFNTWETFTRDLNEDYLAEFGVAPKEGKEIRIGHAVNDSWVGDHGGTIQNITFVEDTIPPVADIGGPYVANEGETLTFDASSSFDPEPGTGIASIEWDLDSDGEYDDAQGVTISESFGDDFEKTIGIKVTDGAGNFSTDSTTVTIENVAPTITLDKSNLTTFFGGDAFVATLEDLIAFPLRVTDPGSDDLTLFTNFGDESTQADTFFNDPNVGFDPFPSIDIHPRDINTAKLHQYSLPNVYQLMVTAVDDDGGVAEDTLLVLITDTKTEIRTQGFWKNQYGEDLGGGVQYPEGYLLGFWETTKFVSKVYDEVTSAQTLVEIEEILSKDGEGNPMIERAKSQCLSTHLNFSSGSIKWSSQVDTNYDGIPDTIFSEAVSSAEDLITDPSSTDPELEQAKDICDSINNMEKISSGGFNFAYLFAFALPALLVLGRIFLRFIV